MSCCSNHKQKEAKHHTCCSTSKEYSSDCSSEETSETSTCDGEDADEDPSCCSSKKDESAATSEGEKLDFIVHGMDCPSCAASVEKGLHQLTGINEARISYASEKLHLLVNNQFDAEEMEKTVTNLGFTLEHQEQNIGMKTYTIEGMDCGSCAKSIENHVIRVDGVNDVEVSFATGKAHVDHTNPTDEIIKEIKKIGFSATFDGDKRQSRSTKNNGFELGKIILSGLFIATGFIGTYTAMPTIVSTILFAIVIVLSGAKPIKSAFYAIRSKSLDMNVLMSSAAIGAAIIGEWFEGATVVWLFSFGIYLQNRSMDQTRKSIRHLMDLTPSKASVLVNGEIVETRVEDVQIGDTLIVKPGDKVPLDGKVLQGTSTINQAPITGESLPVNKDIGDTVFAGTINESGSLDIEVTKLIEDTTLSKIIHLVEEAQEQKAPTEAFIDRFAAIYTPIVFILALLIIVVPPVIGMGSWADWTYKGLALLVVACPCALVISTPVAIVSAIGNSAKNGVLIKGGTFLETAGTLDTIAFDKTGTLTNGTPTVSDIHAIDLSEADLISIAQTIESRSTHPIAKAIVDYGSEKDIALLDAEQYQNIVGKGVQATIDGKTYYAGSPRLFTEMNVVLDDVIEKVQSLEQEGKTSIMIGTDEKILGTIAVADAIRETTDATIQALKAAHIKDIVMLTGDNERTAKTIAAETGVDRYFAELLPEDKVAAVKELQQEGKKVAMVGDGINDAPALATADLGIAMGVAGTDTAMETADVVLMSDDLEKLPYTAKLSRRAINIIKQNIWFSILIKSAALILIFPGWLTLWMAVLSDTGAAIIVILNALRLLRVKD